MAVFCDGSKLRAPDSGLLGLPCLCSSCSVVGTEVQSSITETYTVFLDEKLLSVTIWRFITPNPCLQVLYSASSTKSVLTCWLLTLRSVHNHHYVLEWSPETEDTHSCSAWLPKRTYPYFLWVPMSTLWPILLWDNLVYINSSKWGC